jgi:hypothetical protein
VLPDQHAAICLIGEVGICRLREELVSRTSCFSQYFSNKLSFDKNYLLTTKSNNRMFQQLRRIQKRELLGKRGLLVLECWWPIGKPKALRKRQRQARLACFEQLG